jgi:hypothetical protein
MIRRIKRYKATLLQILRHKNTLVSVLAFAARWRLPWLAARILVTMPTPLSIEANAAPGPRSRRILILNSGKDEFYRDIQEIFRGDTTFELVTWPHYAIRPIANVLLDQSLRHDAYVTNDPAIEATKPRYRRFLYAMWRRYQRLRPIDAVISANFGYCLQREFAFALEKYGTPFLVVQKENLNGATEERRQIWHTIYKYKRGKFGGRKILVYNEMERDLELASDVVDPECVEVVGMPRLDRLHRWRREHAGPETDSAAARVMFFSFSRSDKLPVESRLTNGWGAFCADTHRAMLDLAHKRADIQITMKTKGITRQDEQLLELLNAGEASPATNLHIVTGGDAFELMAASRVVVGFNTTGLLEALTLGKPVIVPRFGEAIDPDLSKFVIDLGNAVEYADSPGQLQELVSGYAGRPLVTPMELSASVESILRYWVGNDDGQAGRRAYNAIHREVIGR